MSANTCGSCRFYIDGLHVLRDLFRGGSVCQCERSKAYRLLRMRGDKPFDETCFEPIEAVRCKCSPLIQIQERIIL
jgi:hypothetical protein